MTIFPAICLGLFFYLITFLIIIKDGLYSKEYNELKEKIGEHIFSGKSEEELDKSIEEDYDRIGPMFYLLLIVYFPCAIFDIVLDLSSFR